jgi:HD-like signal output (HDOD) protein
MAAGRPGPRDAREGESPTGRVTRTSPVEERLSAILEDHDFPALSRQIVDTISALDDDATSVRRLANVVLREYSLTLRVIRTANSAHYRRGGRPIQSATQAMLLIGARTVRHLAGSLLLFEHYHRQSPGLRELMLLSLITANHAREVAVRLGLGDPEEAHLCGMFRNLGEVLIACHSPQDYARIHALERDGRHEGPQAAFEILEFTYEDLGEAMSRHWGMPESVLQGLRARGPQAASRLGAVIAFSHELTRAIYRAGTSESLPDAALEDVMARYARQLALTREQVREVVDAALAETREVFAGARVTVDDLRLRRLSNAACVALGAAPRPSGDWDAAVEATDAAAAMVELRERLLQEAEGTVDPASGSDLGHVLLMALEGALRGGPFDRVVALVLTPRRTELRARSGLGVGVERLLEAFHFPLNPRGGPLVSALLRKEATYFPVDRELTAEEARWAHGFGAASFGVFPVTVDGALVGCLYCDRVDAASRPDGATVAFIVQLTALVVRAIRDRRASAGGRASPGVASDGDSRSAGPAEAGRWSAEVKVALVLRLLRGEAPAAVSRESGASPTDLEAWKQAFLEGAAARLGDG